MMKWNHLPAPGGIYAQRPALLDKFLTIAKAEGEAEAEKLKKEKNASNRNRRGKRMH